MFNSKKVKALLLAMSFSMLLSHSAHAATYRVKSGDSLYKISKQFHTTTAAIMKANKLSRSAIRIGQVLSIPSKAPSSKPAVKKSVSKPTVKKSSTNVTYTVKKGDNLYLIAKKYHITVNNLKKANKLSKNTLKTGQKLVIPGVKITSTTSSLRTTSTSASRGTVAYTPQDIDLLARLITAEALDQPYSAKVGVGAVVVNRVKSSIFPDSIRSVIYQKSDGYYQFTPVKNGWINKPATPDARSAAYEALHGSDPSKGALYYFDDSTSNKWLWSKQITARIDDMVFVH